MYTISGFLDKNRDVVQDQLYEYMRNSKIAFVRSVTKFQNMLESERKTIMASKIRRTGGSTAELGGGSTSKVDIFEAGSNNLLILITGQADRRRRLSSPACHACRCAGLNNAVVHSLHQA